MIDSVLKRWAWDCFDLFGRLVAVNVPLAALAIAGWALVADVSQLLPESAAAGVLLWAVVIAVPLPILGVLWFAPLLWFLNVDLRREVPPLKRLWEGLRTRWSDLLRYLVACGAITASLWASFWFYAIGDFMPERIGTVSYVLAGLCLWALALVPLTMMHGLPLAVRRKRPLVELFKVSFALTVARFRITALCAGLLVVMWFFSWLCQLTGIVLIAFSATAVLLNALHEDTLRWQRTLSGESVPDDYGHYQRTVGEVLRPWQ